MEPGQVKVFGELTEKLSIMRRLLGGLILPILRSYGYTDLWSLRENTETEGEGTYVYIYIYIHTLHMVLSPLWSPFLYPSSYLLLQLNSVHQGNSTKSSVMVYTYIYIYTYTFFLGGSRIGGLHRTCARSLSQNGFCGGSSHRQTELSDIAMKHQIASNKPLPERCC